MLDGNKKIHAYTLDLEKKIIMMAVGQCDENGNYLPYQRYETVSIDTENYDYLMQAGSTSEKKPENTFRLEDLEEMYKKGKIKKL